MGREMDRWIDGLRNEQMDRWIDRLRNEQTEHGLKNKQMKKNREID